MKAAVCAVCTPGLNELNRTAQQSGLVAYVGSNTNNHWLFADKISLLASSGQNLQHPRDQFAAMKDQARSKIRASSSSPLEPVLSIHCLAALTSVHVLCNYSIVSSSRTLRPSSPWGTRWIGHWRKTWSTVCTSAQHSQVVEEVMPHLCKQERKRPTPVRRRLSRIHTVPGRVIPGVCLGAGVGDKFTDSRSVVKPFRIPHPLYKCRLMFFQKTMSVHVSSNRQSRAIGRSVEISSVCIHKW